MTYATQAARYREMEVLSASPGQLVVILFDHVLASLQRARFAIERGAVETRIEALHRSRSALAELLSTLDRERGGSIARDLSALYGFLLSELMDIGLRPDVQRLGRVIGIVRELREAFAAIAGHGQRELEPV